MNWSWPILAVFLAGCSPSTEAASSVNEDKQPLKAEQAVSGLKACQVWRDKQNSGLAEIKQLGWQPKNDWKNKDGQGVYAFINSGSLTASQQFDPSGVAFRSRCELNLSAKDQQSADEIQKAVNREFASTNPGHVHSGMTEHHPSRRYAKEKFYFTMSPPDAKGVQITTLIEWDPRFGLSKAKDN